jgi:hypothetical protein
MLTGAVEMAPGVGESVGLTNTRQAIRSGDYGTAAILGGATSLGMVPVTGHTASRAIREGLDMSQAASMQGRFVPNTLYHGTSKFKSEGQIFDEFKKFEGEDLTRSSSRSPVGKLGISLGEQPELAEDFAKIASPAEQNGAAISPVRFRTDRVGSVDLVGDETNDEIYNTAIYAWKTEYDAIDIDDYTSPGAVKVSFVLAKEPNQIRIAAVIWTSLSMGSFRD